VRYWDSSALVALHVEQPATDLVRDLYAEDPDVLTWVLSDVEVRSGIARLGRDGAMDQVEIQAAISRIETFWESVNQISLVESVKPRAKRLLGVHVLKAADALQLGAALAAVYDNPLGWEFVCLDQRLATAARREGFSVMPS
jgi:predicted nucleic acid-binding protein